MTSSVGVATEVAAPMREGGPAALHVDGILKRWDPTRLPVLDHINLVVEPGTVVAIGGDNGAGKTTLLRIAAGLILPDAGTVRAFGLEPERERTEFQRRVGFVTAGNTGLYGRLRVEHHLDLVARLALLPRDRRDAAIAEALEAFGLRDLCGKRVDRLSMGQRQRVRLALGLLHGPDLALLDEPHTSLDEDGTARLVAALERLRDRGGSAVVCSPTGDERALPEDRRYVIQDGALLAA